MFPSLPIPHFTHNTAAGNIFQILEFGISSESHKERMRNTIPASTSQEFMCGIRVKAGSSYQTKDSICLSIPDGKYFAKGQDITFLADPSLPVYGLKADERDPSLGYGHGIRQTITPEGLAVGNSTAYKDEVLAAGNIGPSRLLAVVVPEHLKISSSFGMHFHNLAAQYQQNKSRDPHAAEDLLATAKLVADKTGSADLIGKLRMLEQALPSMPLNHIPKEYTPLLEEALRRFANEKTLSEEGLRGSLVKCYRIPIINRNDFLAR
jgi:hypothetical protein